MCSNSNDKDHYDIEVELFGIKRSMLNHYNNGSYENALTSALLLTDKVLSLYGEKNAIYASCLNNVALMNKMLGNNDIAMEHYIKALHIYEDTNGKQNESYAATLMNLGVIYKSTAEYKKGLEKQQLLERSEEALNDSIKIRTFLQGQDHKETLKAKIHLASLYRIYNKINESEDMLRKIINIGKKVHGKLDLVTATASNNLGMLLKTTGRYKEAHEFYEDSLRTRSNVLGDGHPDTLISMNNFAELLIAIGEQDKAAVLQQKILDTIGEVSKKDDNTNNNTTNTVNTNNNNDSNIVSPATASAQAPDKPAILSKLPPRRSKKAKPSTEWLP
jgi:tetratricopeptide (TPR) repeat protein